MNYFHVLILALIQGAAELLPVSSSAHVILVQHWLGLDPSHPQMVFLLVMLHTGTMGAVLIFFHKRWLKLISQNPKDLLLKLMGATVATAVLGFLLKFIIEKFLIETEGAEVEDLFRNRPAVALALASAGLLILLSGLFLKKTKAHFQNSLNFKHALLIGLVQGICLPFRGFSRSGATISTALFLKIKKELAEDFSFLLAVIITPPVILRSLHKLHKLSISTGVSSSELVQQTIMPGLVGACFSFLSGLLALKFLSHMLEKNNWAFFGIYCFFIAAIIFSGF